MIWKMNLSLSLSFSLFLLLSVSIQIQWNVVCRHGPAIQSTHTPNSSKIIPFCRSILFGCSSFCKHFRHFSLVRAHDEMHTLRTRACKSIFHKIISYAKCRCNFFYHKICWIFSLCSFGCSHWGGVKICRNWKCNLKFEVLKDDGRDDECAQNPDVQIEIWLGHCTTFYLHQQKIT